MTKHIAQFKTRHDGYEEDRRGQRKGTPPGHSYCRGCNGVLVGWLNRHYGIHLYCLRQEVGGTK